MFNLFRAYNCFIHLTKIRIVKNQSKKSLMFNGDYFVAKHRTRDKNSCIASAKNIVKSLIYTNQRPLEYAARR